MQTRYMAGTSSLTISLVGVFEVPNIENSNHTRAFCDLYLNTKPAAPFDQPVQKKSVKKSNVNIKRPVRKVKTQ